MKSIIFINQKGGVGKSTIAANVLTYLVKNNYSVSAIDTDPQLSLYSFLTNRESNKEVKPIPFQDSQVATLENKLLNLENNNKDFVVIDTQGHANNLIKNVLQSVSNIVIPIQPSSIDYEATLPLLKLLLQEGIKHYKILINCVPTNSNKNAKELQAELMANNIPCFSSMVCLRNLYKEAFFLGKGICEYQTEKKNEENAKKEFECFMKEFLNWINEE